MATDKLFNCISTAALSQEQDRYLLCQKKPYNLIICLSAKVGNIYTRYTVGAHCCFLDACSEFRALSLMANCVCITNLLSRLCSCCRTQTAICSEVLSLQQCCSLLCRIRQCIARVYLNIVYDLFRPHPIDTNVLTVVGVLLLFLVCSRD